MEKKEKKKREKKPPQEFWPELVEAWFNTYKNFKGEEPDFEGSAPRDLISIVGALKKRAISAGVEWTSENAVKRLIKFLEYSYKDFWLKENYMLHNLNRQKEKIFSNIIQNRNGGTKDSGLNQKPVASIQSEGSFGSL